MSKWVMLNKRADFIKMGEKFLIDPCLSRVIRNRGLITEEEVEKYLFATKEDMYDPFLLFDMKCCVEKLYKEIKNKSKIRIIGDYDIDGICSSYILYRGIKEMGGIVDIAIPDRMIDGYGLNKRLIIDAKKDGIETIITCDNGIAAFESVELAKKENMVVLVTDHHEVPFFISEQKKEYRIPNADAVVNPKREDCQYPFKGICGALVAYKVIDALLTLFQAKREILEELLGFAAFATIGDVMELVDENRIVVKFGLPIIEQTKNLGLRALIKACQLEGKKITPYHIGFILGPCINATGRLDSAKRAVQLFLCTNEVDAYRIATELIELNEERKRITLEGVKKAVTYLETQGLETDKVLVVYLEDCHESIAGIIAGRIREKYQKPTFVLTKTEFGVKGSGRSIEAYSMFEKMSVHKELFEKFGGHKAAAGLSMKEENVQEFRKVINETSELKEDDLQEVTKIDLELPLSYINKKLVKQFEVLEPFGVSNKKPLFAQRSLKFIRGMKLGIKGRARKIVVEDEFGFRTQVINFKEEEEFRKLLEKLCGEGSLEQLYKGIGLKTKMNILYYPSINTYMGKESIQFILEDFKPII